MSRLTYCPECSRPLWDDGSLTVPRNICKCVGGIKKFESIQVDAGVRMQGAELKTKYKYLEFVIGAGKEEKDWTVWNKYDDFLGLLVYNKKWKDWELCPEPNTGWTTQCLLDTVDFIKQLKAPQSA